MEDLFSRKRASFYLRATFDLPTTPASLATMATRGGGPRFFRIGKYARYRRRDLDEWALKRFSVLMDSTSTRDGARLDDFRSEEHTSELQSLMRISYAVFCLKKKKKKNKIM